MSKKQLRLELNNILGGIQTSLRESKNQALSKNLNAFLIKLSHSSSHFDIKEDYLGAYAPFGLEPDWSSLLVKNHEWNISFPRFVSGGNMEFCDSNFRDLVLSNNFGPDILVPVKNAKVVVPKVIITPGLGFEKTGARLGKGGGYYDRYFSRNQNAIKVGVAFSEQVLIDVFCEDHDIAMDYLITDLNILKCK